MDVEIISGNPAPKLSDLNNKAISKLYELLDGLDAKSDPDLVRAVVESLAKLNSSLKGSDILPHEETPEQRAERETQEAIAKAMGGEA